MPSTTISSTDPNATLKAELIRDEGCRDRPYKDSLGHWTIAVGHNLDAEGLCPAAILAQLDYDIEQKQQELDARLGWWKNQPQPVQRVLLNIAFNIGVGGLLKFTTTLGHIQRREYALAADSLLENARYHAQIGKRLDRLANLLRSVV